MEKEYDVVIIGGGTSGCACAYICAKNGLRTLLVEKNNFLGGLMTGGLVVPVMKSGIDDLNCEYYRKLVETAKKFNAQTTYKDKNDGWFNPVVLRIVLDDILSSFIVKDNIDILFETTVDKVECDKDSIKKIVLNSNLNTVSIKGKYFVDATGSAEFSVLANCDLINDSSIYQQSSLRFILGNVDIEKFCDFICAVDKDENITNTNRNDLNCNELHFTTASTWDTNKLWALDKYLKKGVEEGVLLDIDRSYFQIFSIAKTKNQVAFNCPRINMYKNDPYKASVELIKARKAIYRLFNFTRIYFPGFEEAIITNIAVQTGVREQNRVKTRYIYKESDLKSSKTFKTPVLRANYPIDVHIGQKNSSILQKTASYELPIESLMSFNYKNLFVIGKILGAEFLAHSALRVQKSCMSMGEGVANYIKNL